MLNRLTSLLKIRADESRLVILVGLLFACIQAGQGMGDNAASALFLLRYGVDFLPYMYLFLGALTFITTLAYSAALGRLDKGKFFSTLIAIFIGLLVLERAAILFPFPLLYPMLWLTVNGISMILGTFVWNLAGEVCDARQAKRLFPLFTSAGILGSVIGNAVTGVTARLFGTDNLLLLYAVLLGVALYLTRVIAGAYFRKEKVFKNKSNLWDDLRAGFDFVRVSPLMRLIAYSSILFSVLFFSIAFPFNKVVTASFTDEAGVAGFFGLFNSITTASTFLVSLFLASRIYTRLGIINGVFLMPLTYIFSFAVFAGFYNLNGAAIARFAQLVILSGIAGTAWNALFNVVPARKRGQVLAFNNGVPSQIGVVLSGVLLIVAERAFTVQQIFLMGTILAFVCGVLIWRMRKAYAQALVDALQAGRLEVFSANEASFSGFQGDAAVLDVAIRALQDAKPTTRRLAADMLGRMESDSAISHLTRLLSDPEPAVRASAVSSLGILCADSAINEIILSLDDSDNQVREEALTVLPKLKAIPSPELITKISGMMKNDSSLSVQTKAIIALTKLGDVDESISNLTLRLNSNDPRLRLSALETVTEVPPSLNHSFDIKSILDSLENSSATIRAAAVFALGSFKNDSVCKVLIKYLTDVDESVRKAAAETLRQRSDESRELVLELFASNNSAVDSALDALAPGNPESLAPLREYAKRETVRARTLRNQSASLPSTHHATRFLHDCLRRQASLCEGRLIKTVGLFGDTHTMELIRKSMSGTNIENRAAALEALDTIGDKQLAKSVVSLLEEEPQLSDPSDVIAVLLKSTDPWVRILAIHSTSELGLREFIPLLHQLKSGSDSLMREAALGALTQFGEEKLMDTLKTVSILERILLLREIPIFADLSPEDLKLVAETAREEWYPQNAVIFHQGEEGNMMFVIVEGQLQVLRSADGTEQVLAQRGSGDFVGEMAIIESTQRSATLRTRTEVRVLAIDGETFKGILRERPDVSFAVLRSISRRLREMGV
ncbi:MAG: cyclic nucleotide-binding domain-containing protein [Anaerolineales bacterium]|nr:cyclic nucleotide-binding domain-containing protein [Anaerolineales bacterium]